MKIIMRKSNCFWHFSAITKNKNVTARMWRRKIWYFLPNLVKFLLVNPKYRWKYSLAVPIGNAAQAQKFEILDKVCSQNLSNTYWPILYNNSYEHWKWNLIKKIRNVSLLILVFLFVIFKTIPTCKHYEIS